MRKSCLSVSPVYLLWLEYISVDLVDLLGDGVAGGSVTLIILRHQLVQTLAGVPGDQIQERTAQLVQLVHHWFLVFGLLQQGLDRITRHTENTNLSLMNAQMCFCKAAHWASEVFQLEITFGICFFRGISELLLWNLLPSACFVHEWAARPLAPDQQRRWSQPLHSLTRSSGLHGYAAA